MIQIYYTNSHLIRIYEINIYLLKYMFLPLILEERRMTYWKKGDVVWYEQFSQKYYKWILMVENVNKRCRIM